MNADDDERTADMANPAAKYTDEFRRETADYIISTGMNLSVRIHRPSTWPS